MAQASRGYFAISKETTPGTAITTPTKFYPLEEVDFVFENEFKDWSEIGLSRQRYRTIDGAIKPSATLKGPVYAGGAVGHFLQGLVGGWSGALVSGTAYKHTFTDAVSLPYFTLERSDAANGAGGILCERLAGAKVESMGFSCAFGEKLDMDVAFQALNTPVTASAVSAGSVSYVSGSPKALYFKGASVTIDSVANNLFKNVKLNFKNTLTRQDTLRGSQNSYKIYEGGFQCELSGAMAFEDTTMYQKMTSTTEMKVELLFQSDTLADTTSSTPYSLKFTYDSVRISKHGTPFKAGDVIEADCTFKVNFNETNSRSVLIEMTNKDNATAYSA